MLICLIELMDVERRSICEQIQLLKTSSAQATDHLSIDSPKPNWLLRTQNQLIWRSGLPCEPGATVVQQILILIKMRVN